MAIGGVGTDGRMRRWLSLFLECVLAIAVAALLVPWITGRAAVGSGAWRVSLDDAYRPLVVALACAGLLGLLTARGERYARWRVASWTCLAAAAAFVAAIALRGRPDAYPAGDLAVAELYVLHTTRGTWALGPYSQFYWHHPGPLMFQLLAPLYAAAGQHPAALSLGAGLINGGALAAGMWLAARRLPAIVAGAVFLASLVWVIRSGGLVTSYWNPHLIVLPLLLYFWLAVTVAAGATRLMPALAAAGTFLVQTHVGTTPVVATLGALAVALAWIEARRGPEGPVTWRRALNATAWVAILLWALPLAEELTARPGNMTRLAAWFWEHRGDGQPLAGALSTWGQTLSSPIWAPWFTPPVGWAVPAGFQAVAAILGVVQVAALALVAWRDRGSAWATACGLAAAAGVVALLSIARIPGQVQDHAVFWVGILGTIGVGLLLGVAALRIAPLLAHAIEERDALVRTMTTGVLAAVVLLSTVVHVGPAGPGAGGDTPPIRDLYVATAEGLERHRAASPLVRIDGDVWSEAAGTLLQLHKRGVPLAVERESLHMFGAPFAAAGCGGSHVLRFVRGGVQADGEAIARAGRVEARLDPAPACSPIEP
jgi:hypothetical protein